MKKPLLGKNYYGSIPEVEMRRFNQCVEKIYWKDALDKSCGTIRKKRDWFFSSTRTSFFPYIKLKKSDTVLDVGAGSGVISAALSKKVNRVVSLEKGSENIRFMKQRFNQDGVKNISILKGDALDLPFANNIFNVVIMNGVVEWLPNADIKTSPETLQLKGLKEAFRVLKESGQLYIGIENRSYFKYFLGYPDPHSGLRWVTILPRGLARIYSRLRTKKPYINYLYTHKGYMKILKGAGFSKISFYWAIPNYNNILQIVPLEWRVRNYFLKSCYFPLNNAYVNTFKKRVHFALIHILPPEMLMHSFLIIAKK